MNINQERQYKTILIETMKAFIKFCNENHLKYIAAYGTVLGAVRHKGLIPWDDDIDVYMPREDYEKFINLKEKANSFGYEIVDYKNKGYYLPYAKFCDKNTTLWELKELPYIIGVFIDIFPIDECSKDIFNYEYIKQKYKLAWSHYFRCLLKPARSFKIRKNISAFKNFIYRLFFMKKFATDFIKNENTIKNLKGNFYVYYDLTNPISIDKSTYPKEWIDNTIDVEFEDFKIKIPEKYHEYLLNEYGDYLKLPPIEQQKSQHFHYYINLDKRLSIEDIIKIKKQ